ncbi:DEAD/DEAH box helicase family protein [Saccharomonospora cyanea]|uniref:Helicase, type I site-specific restriction-modification system restriction subunit n=1 Tax=Saccharomonospora cyanea NA-134 TaxID=882082 RepID=H5XN65_9PSEU|nr:DEAD/DEAH box helicase family protein [Saccharomonospora cyanea]EHR63698.1 helicase, type I site-specific restriction-modification system restriction subunit [Saccharomonospora cyanea NA-134]
MQSNFGFLRVDWPELFEDANRAEWLAFLDPRTSCFYARRTLEHVVLWLYEAERSLGRPYRNDLKARLHESAFLDLVGTEMQAKMNLIRVQGNNAVHGKRPVRQGDSTAVVRELFQVAVWLGRNYARHADSRPAAGIMFDLGLLPKPGAVREQAKKTRDELKRLEAELQAKDEALAEERRKSGDLDAQIAQLRAEVAEAKRANQARPDEHDYDEAATRDHYIDLLLREAGWPLDQPQDREYEVTGMPTRTGGGYIDYVLWDDDGKPLAVVEAKRARRDPEEGKHQAKLYADCLEERFGQRPLIYYTNGFRHHFWDDKRYPTREVQGFHTKDELRLTIQRRTSRRPLAEATINRDIVDRDYQHCAIRRINERFEKENQRKALVVMATGAGKTRTTVALVDVLLRCNWVKRVLFLADRTALVKQATNVFKAHLPESAPVNLLEEKEDTGARVYVSTYQTMLGMLNADEGDERRFSIGYFDLVIIDEAHRSVYRKYKSIFSYFDSLLVGLTATPRDEIDRDTYGLFNLERGVPTDAYPLERAIKEKWLVPYRVIEVPLKIQTRGLRYSELSEEEKAHWDELEWDPDGDAKPTEIRGEEVGTWVFNRDTVDKMLEMVMTCGLTVAGGDRLGKTIIFAKNQKHANFIAERFDAIYPEHSGKFAQVITNNVKHAQSIIDDFSTPDREPHIAISVDMLDTGIDVPEVVNLVFFKTVHSRTKFWQMIGRGTRLAPDLFAPGQAKTEFYIFDFCRNFEFFDMNPQLSEPRVPVPLSQKLFQARLELLAAIDSDGDPDDEPLRRDVADLLHRIVRGMNVGNIEVRPHRRWVERYADRAAWDSLGAQAHADIAEHLSGLPSAERDDDEQAKRFDYLTLRLQLCVLRAEPGFERLRDTVWEIAESLLTRTNIPAVKQQAELLESLTDERWWINVTPAMLEEVRRRVRGLVKLIDRTNRNPVYSDFIDEYGEVVERPYERSDAGAQVDMERFHAKVRDFLHRHDDNLALQKLRRNRPLTETDLSELEHLLVESGEFDEAALRRSIEEARGLGAFIRSLVGLERESVVEALSEFLDATTFSSKQIDFVKLIVDHLTHNGMMEPSALYDPPFVDHAPSGPEVLFPSERLNQLHVRLAEINARASAS